MKIPRLLSLLAVLSVALLSAVKVRAENPADFTLASATTEATFTLSKAKGSYVALHFLLKTECPFCLRHTQTYFSRSAELPGVIQVFIKPDSVDAIKAWAAKLPPDILAKNPIYRDPGASLATAFSIPDGYSFHGQTVHYPALVLIGPDGREVFRYVGKSNKDRFSFDQLKAKIAELTAAR